MAALKPSGGACGRTIPALKPSGGGACGRTIPALKPSGGGACGRTNPALKPSGGGAIWWNDGGPPIDCRGSFF